MNTTTTKATDIQIGDMLPTVDGRLRKVTDIDITPAAVRIRTGRSQHWMRVAHHATFEVA